MKLAARPLKAHRRTPVQVVIVRNVDDPDTDPFVDFICRAVSGRNESYTGYISESLGIGIPVREPAPPENDKTFVAPLISAAEKTIVVEIKSRQIQPNGKPNPYAKPWTLAQQALVDAAKEMDELRYLPTAVPEPVAIDTTQVNATETGAMEPGLWPLATALGVLEMLREELQAVINDRKTTPAKSGAGTKEAADEDRAYRTLFISHAKADGAVTAVAVADFCRRVNTWFSAALKESQLNFFYDAESIPVGSDWASVLEQAAKSSVLIALRTDQYETRYWCREEFRVAEENNRPIVVVDLRKSLTTAGSPMTFDSATRVLVSDGNTARVVLHGIAAHLRQLKLEAEVALTPGRAQQVRVLARQPSVATIRGLALEAVKPSQPAETPDDTTDKASERYVIYPGPPIDRFDQNLYQERLTSALGVPVKLCTMDEWEVERTQRESCMTSKALWINLSYSPCDPAKHLGITAHQMNLLGMRCAQFWLGKGERLLFGHDWRDDGVMRSIGDLAELTTPHRFTQRGLGFPRMLNVIPHPAGQRLERHGIEAQRTSSGMLSVRRLYDVVFHPENLAGRESAPGNGELDVADATIFRAARRVPWLGALLGNPQLAETSLATTDPGPPPPVTRELLYAERDETYRDKMPVYLHWNASANIRLWTLRAVLTEMLGQRTDKVNGIRICFGGKTSGYTGWMPGVFEEAVFALLRRVPAVHHRRVRRRGCGRGFGVKVRQTGKERAVWCQRFV